MQKNFFELFALTGNGNAKKVWVRAFAPRHEPSGQCSRNSHLVKLSLNISLLEVFFCLALNPTRIVQPSTMFVFGADFEVTDTFCFLVVYKLHSVVRGVHSLCGDFLIPFGTRYTSGLNGSNSITGYSITAGQWRIKQGRRILRQSYHLSF